MMLWFAAIFAVVIGGAVGLLTRDMKRAFFIAVILFLAGTLLSILIVYSGILGG